MARDCPTGQHDKHDVYGATCPCRGVLDLLAHKWSVLAIGAMEDGPSGLANSSECWRASARRY